MSYLRFVHFLSPEIVVCSSNDGFTEGFKNKFKNKRYGVPWLFMGFIFLKN